jgi:hypothetical protein
VLRHVSELSADEVKVADVSVTTTTMTSTVFSRVCFGSVSNIGDPFRAGPSFVMMPLAGSRSVSLRTWARACPLR